MHKKIKMLSNQLGFHCTVKNYCKWKQTPRWCNLVKSVTWEDTKGLHCKYPGKLHTIPYNFNVRNCIGALTGKPNAVLANGIIRSLVRARKSTLRLVMSFIATTSKRLDYVCPAANRTWQRLTIISCDLTYERDTYFLNISHINYPIIIIYRA